MSRALKIDRAQAPVARPVAPQHEHEFEPEFGLPEELPAGEKLLWQGMPDWRAMARHVFHVPMLTAYFALILTVRAATVLSFGGSLRDAVIAIAWLLPFAALALAIVTLMAYLTGRTTVYTFTDQRVVMRIGIVLSLTFNLPLRSIRGAGLRRFKDGSADIPLTLDPEAKIAYVHLWPHARPWRLAQPEPMLRCVPDAVRASQILAAAWSARTGVATSPTPQPAIQPTADPAWGGSLTPSRS
jgi:hypothetical protein